MRRLAERKGTPKGRCEGKQVSPVNAASGKQGDA